MYPWEHAAVAYLLYAGYARWHDGAPPGGWLAENFGVGR